MRFSIEDVRCTAETDKAILCHCDDWGEPEWIPKSQIDDDSEVYELGTDGTLVISAWFAAKRGWV